jgi:hypothetical protein
MVVQLLLGSTIPDLGELLIAWALDLTLRGALLNELECMVHSTFVLREKVTLVPYRAGDARFGSLATVLR